MELERVPKLVDNSVKIHVIVTSHMQRFEQFAVIGMLFGGINLLYDH